MKRFFQIFLGLVFSASLLAQTRAVIGTGSAANDGTGDSIQTAFKRANTNFLTLWDQVFTNGAQTFTTNWFSLSSGKVEISPTVNLTNDWTVKSGTSTSSTYGVTFYPLANFSAGANTAFKLLTPSVNAGTATAGQVLKLSNATTGQSEFAWPAPAGTIESVSVTSIASMKALTVSLLRNGQTILTSGYYTAGDGGSGVYQYDSASAASDDGGAVIAPTAGSGRFLLINAVHANVKQYGAKGDGATDDTASFLSALAICNGGSGRLFIPRGTYSLNGTLASDCDIDHDGATLSWVSGFSGVGMYVGPTNGVTSTGRKLRIPTLNHVGAYTNRSSSDVGVRIRNLYSSTIDLGSACTGWYYSVWIGGSDAGLCFNTVNMGRHYDNKICVRLEPEGTGWCNQNVFLAGEFTSTSTYGDRPAIDNGSRYMVCKGINGNSFLGASFEGASAFYTLEVVNCNNNTMEGVRIEKAYSLPVQILTDATAGKTTVNNSIGLLYFSCSGQTFPSVVTGASGGTVYPVAVQISGHRAINGWESEGRGLLTLQNQQSAGNSAVSVYDNTTDISASPGNWSTKVSASTTQWKSPTDTVAKLQVNNALGWLQFGSGAGAVDSTFYRNSANVLRTGGMIIMDTGARIGILGTTTSRIIHGTAILSSGTVTVANTSVTAVTRIIATVKTPGGTQGFLSTSRSAGVSFTITSTSGTESSTVEYILIEP